MDNRRLNSATRSKFSQRSSRVETIFFIIFDVFLLFPVTKSNRAGCTLSVARIERKLRNGGYAKRIGATAGVYMTGVLEYLMAEVLDLAGNVADDNKRVRITPNHIKMAIENDSELKELLQDVHIPEASVKKIVDPVVLPEMSNRNDHLIQWLQNMQIWSEGEMWNDRC